MKRNTFSVILSILISIVLITSGCAGTGSVTGVSQGGNGQDQVAVSDTGSTTNESSSTTKVKDKDNTTSDDSDSEVWSNTGTITLGNTISYTGTGVSVNGSKVTIKAGGDFTVTGTLADGMIYVDTTEKVKLRLSGVNITNSSGPAIFIQNAKKAFITLTEGTTNTLTDGSKYSVEAKAALFSNDSLEIKGKGTLKVTGNYMHGIASDDDISIENGIITVKGAVDGLHANNNVTVSGGNLTIFSSSDGIDSEGDVIIDGGIFSIAANDDGMHADTDLTVNSGKIDITSSYEGLEGKNTLTVGGGTIRIKAKDDALNSGNKMIVNNGYIYVDCEGDGFDSNCDMAINGGTVVIYSGNNANGPLDIGDRTGTFTINGGTVIAAGGNMGITTSDSSKQYSIWINAQLSGNSLVNISDKSGNEITTFSPIKSCSLIFYSSSKLKGNTTYNISTGGSYSGKATDGIYSNGSYTAGSQLGSVTMSSKSASLGQSNFGGPGGGGGFGGGGKGRR